MDDNEMKSHMVVAHVESVISCPFCSLTGTNVNEVDLHINTVHAGELSPPAKVSKRENANSNSVALQTAGVSSANSNTRASTSSTNSHITCPYCKEVVENESALDLHIRFGHDDLVPTYQETPSVFTCPVCDAIFDDVSRLEAHTNMHFESETELYSSASGINLQRDRSVLRRSTSLEVMASSSRTSHSEATTKASQTISLENLKPGSSKARRFGGSSSNTQLQPSITDFFAQEREGGKDLRDHIRERDQQVDDGSTCTRHMLQRLERYFQHCHTEAFLASESDHYGHATFDRGWGCGYRNIQMMLSCLFKNPAYQTVLQQSDIHTMPSVCRIQELIEAAWAAGFDPAGREQLSGKLVGTKKWIGATEVVTLLSSLRIKCSLIDFHRPTGEGVKHPCLVDWIDDYFRDTRPLTPPLYLQHQGHSRTVVGIEERAHADQILLIFDPSTSRRQLKEMASSSLNDILLSNIRVEPYELKAQQYQLVAAIGIIDPEDINNYKLLQSERKP